MFAIPRNYKNSSPNIYLLLQTRFKSKENRANTTSKNAPKIKALNHFDDFYASVFGKEWEPMREALFRRSKYVAVVNNYGDTDKTIELLSNRGAHCLKKLIKVQQEFNDEYLPKPESSTAEQSDNRLEDYIERLQSNEVENIYPQNNCGPDSLTVNDITIRSNKNEKNNKKIKTKSTTMEQSLAEAEIDTSRIIDPSMGLTSESLYQYVPATQLKGMEDYVPESLHYSLYSKGKDFPLIIEPETNFSYPEHLKVYTYEMGSEWNTFPEPRRSETGVYNYYPMDCGSVLAVLALGLSAGDRVLDLCAAPGGKALVTLQTLLPDIVVCNDASLSRVNRIHRVFGDYLYDFTTSNKWRERVLITNFDGREFTDDQGFDKVLVDVPCTTDRKTLKTDGNNIFRPDRIRERLKMPELQAQLLTNALRLVRVGGAVVYSTCALSPVQNDGVVHAALKAAFEAHRVVAAVRDLTIPMAAFSSTLKLGAGASAPKYGQLVVPAAAANFGPTYLSRLVRLR